MGSSAARQVLRENSLRYFEGVPTAPVYMWHGTLDGLTPFDSVAEVAHRYCAAGAKLTFVPYDISERMDHRGGGLPGCV
jgi:Secretory lipase